MPKVSADRVGMRQRAWTDEELARAVSSSGSIAQVLKRLNLRPTGGNYKSIKAHILRLDLDVSHHLGQKWASSQGLNRCAPKRSLEEVLVENSTYTNSSYLKKRLLDAGKLERKCYACNLTKWRETLIPLELEHINGINTDNRLDNLTLLCPNCHALTSTYRGKNIKGLMA